MGANSGGESGIFNICSPVQAGEAGGGGTLGAGACAPLEKVAEPLELSLGSLALAISSRGLFAKILSVVEISTGGCFSDRSRSCLGSGDAAMWSAHTFFASGIDFLGRDLLGSVGQDVAPRGRSSASDDGKGCSVVECDVTS